MQSLPQPLEAPVVDKPLLRGVSHQVSFFFALAAGAWLVAMARAELKWACAVYLAALCGQFLVSALYHRPNWKPEARQWWRRLDHAFIMILIAGTGTPLAVSLQGDASRTLLLLLWVGASLGVLRALFWINAPKPVAAGLALALAWFMSPFLPELRLVLGGAGTTWLLVGGVLYSIGAIAYATKRPALWPRVFGYHEVFHAFVILAAACHFVAVAIVAR
ncbi:MAG: hemolysin III family protein [Archangium sp.]|nr:hemolysin III family protein [Archangium sp.]